MNKVRSVHEKEDMCAIFSLCTVHKRLKDRFVKVALCHRISLGRQGASFQLADFVFFTSLLTDIKETFISNLSCIMSAIC